MRRVVIYRLPHFQLVFGVVRIAALGEGRSLSMDRLPSSELVGEEARWK